MTARDAKLPARENWLDHIAPARAIVLLYAFAALLIRPFEDLPFYDDWTYAWSVAHLLKTGQLEILDWSVHYPLPQIIWGALFCLPFGFSFSALRLSTILLASIGVLALYGTVRECGRTRSVSLAGALILLANPVYFLLSFSFMTDVPFVSLSNIAFFFITRGLSRKRNVEIWVGCAIGVSAFLVRQIAIAIPLSLLFYVLLAPTYRSWKYILPPGVLFIILALLPFVINEIFGTTSQYQNKATWPIEFWLHRPEEALPGAIRILMQVGLALSPLGIHILILSYRRGLFWVTTGILLFLATASVSFLGTIPLPLEETWQPSIFGLFHGIPAPHVLPTWLNYPLFVLAILSSAGLILKMIDLVRDDIGERALLFVWYALSHFVLIMCLWLFGESGSDRYSMVLFSPLIVVAAGDELRSKLAAIGIVILFVISMLITWNETQISRTSSEAVAWLREKDIPLASIDAGYVLNGWNLYAHPENLPPSAVPQQDVPFVTSQTRTPYVLAAAPIPGYRVLRVYEWFIPFTVFEYKMYVLEELPGDLK